MNPLSDLAAREQHSTHHERFDARLQWGAGRLDLTVLRDGAAVLDGMELEFTLDDRRFGPQTAVVGIRTRTVRETYPMYTGKAVGLRWFEHAETRYALEEPDGSRWSLVLRLADDGVAFRYETGAGGGRLGPELTRVPAGRGRAWVLEYTTWYETPRFGADLDVLAEGDYGFPLLIGLDDACADRETFVLLSESDIDGRSSGAHPRFRDGGFDIVTADDEIAVAAGHHTPWRVAIIGSLADIVASQLIDDLAAPANPASVVIPRPGRAAWSWWSSQYSGASLDDQVRFGAFAARQGWEHLLVDCGWDPAWVPELVAVASRSGVQVHLWSAWSDLDGPEALEKLALWRSWGVAGIKVDFMESESQARYRWYDAILAESARVGLMVNFHGSVIPRGWARTHPQVVSYEGIRGAEYYVFYRDPLTPAHNVIQPFTRNVVGSMDYTPVAFSAPARTTTDAHELALGVVYESGIVHFADDPAEYATRPLAQQVLAEIAPAWDEVRLLDGHPDTHTVLARRSGDRWFVGAISATGERTVDLAVSALAGGDADVWLVTDAAGGGLESRDAASVERLTVLLAANGGFVAIVAPAGRPLRRAAPRTELVPPTVTPAVAVLDASGEARLDTDADVTPRVPPGWTAVPGDHAGEWIVGAPPTARPGDLGVVTLERAGHDGVPVVAHARVLAPLGAGEHLLSALPFLSCRNLVGPVERDAANGGGDPRDGGSLTIAGVVFSAGLGVSQESEIRFAVTGSASVLVGSVAIDDETPGTTAVAVVLVDGVELARVELGSGEPPVPFRLPVVGASTLELRTRPAGDGREAHVDWIDVRLRS